MSLPHAPFVPDAPGLPGLMFRHLATPADYSAMLAIRIDSAPHDQIDSAPVPDSETRGFNQAWPEKHQQWQDFAREVISLYDSEARRALFKSCEPAPACHRVY